MFREAQQNLLIAGECLAALHRGEDSLAATVGGMLSYEQTAMLRSFLSSK